MIITTAEGLCDWCENALSSEEVADPRKSEVGQKICDECWSIEYESECGKCQEFVASSEFGEIDSLFSIMGVEGGVGDGLYRVKEHPFYSDNMFSQIIYGDAVERVADATNEEPGVIEYCRRCTQKELGAA